MNKILGTTIGLLCTSGPIVVFGVYPPLDAFTWTVAILLTLIMWAVAGFCFAVAVTS